MAYLGNPKNTIEVLQKYNFNFQKKFGQNFLIDTGILEEIIDSAGITKDDMILEIGPGIGTMTQYLCEAARQVLAVEIDHNLILRSFYDAYQFLFLFSLTASGALTQRHLTGTDTIFFSHGLTSFSDYSCLISILYPVSFAASLAFWPSLPIARES